MLTTAESILLAREPWDAIDAIRQRLARANRDGLIIRRATGCGRGNPAMFSHEDVAVFRALEAIGARADRDALTAASDALYRRPAPDGSEGLAAAVRWTAAELLADRSAVLSLARITIGKAAPEWRAIVHPFDVRPEFPDDSRPTSLVAVPLWPVFAPLLPYFGGDK